MDGASLEIIKERLPATIPSFELIIQNEYSSLDDELEQCGEEVFPCECRPPPSGVSNLNKYACGRLSQCINRTLCIECKAEECPSGEACQNQRFQLFQYANVEVFETPGKGFGLRTRMDLERDDFIGEYVGEVLDQVAFEERSRLYTEAGFKHFYFMTLQKDQIIDATRRGNLSRFMNHSCNPNCVTQKWIVDGVQRIGLFAIKRIPAGAELTFDYKYVRFGVEAQKCLCSEPNCKGIIGQKDDKSDLNLPSSCDEETIYLSSIRDDNICGEVSDLQLTHLLKLLLQSNSDKTFFQILSVISELSIESKKRLLSLHCLSVFNVVLTTFWQQKDILKLILDILLSLPISKKSLVSDCAIDEKIERLSNRIDIPDEIIYKAQELLNKWMNLRSDFIIPKQNLSNKDNQNEIHPGYTLAPEQRYKRSKWTDSKSYNTSPTTVTSTFGGSNFGPRTLKRTSSDTLKAHQTENNRHKVFDERQVKDIIEKARKNALQELPKRTEQRSSSTTDQSCDSTWKRQVSTIVVKNLSRKVKDRLELTQFKDLARTITHKYLRINPRPPSSSEDRDLKIKLSDFVSKYLDSYFKK